MRVEGYIQIVPVWDRRSSPPTVETLRIMRVTKTYPRGSESGALILNISLDVPEEVFMPSTLHVSLDGSNEEIASAIVPVPVESEDAE